MAGEPRCALVRRLGAPRGSGTNRFFKERYGDSGGSFREIAGFGCRGIKGGGRNREVNCKQLWIERHRAPDEAFLKSSWRRAVSVRKSGSGFGGRARGRLPNRQSSRRKETGSAGRGPGESGERKA